MAFTIVTQGTFKQPAVAVNQVIPLPSGADYFVTTNLTQMAAAPATGVVVRAEWYGGGLFADGDGLRWKKTNSTSAINIDKFSNTTASAGFTYVTRFPQPQAALTGTTITQANPAVASVTNTYSNGDQVIIFNAVGMEQISGMVFTISSVTGSQFTLLGLDSSGFATAATAFSVRRLTQNPQGIVTPVAPPALQITKVTQALGAQVTTSQINNLVVGDKIEFTVPASYGMVQLNNFYQVANQPIIVASIVDAYNFTINIDTTNYTAFAMPASALSPTAQLFATIAPAGQATTFNPITMVTTGYDFVFSPFRSGLFLPYMLVPAGAQSPGGAAGDVIVWDAYKMETGTINAPVPS
jgi:hypothetical protein